MAASVDGIFWPSVPAPTPHAAHAIADELEQTQWWTYERLRDHQRMQLARLYEHARRTVPFYGGLPERPPILTRAQVIAAADALLSRGYPSTHGAAPEVSTSRTSGDPVRVRGTGVVGAMNAALTLREHRWHRRDLHASHASLRYAPKALPPDGIATRGWSATTAELAPDAPSFVLSIVGTTTDDQLAWLARTNPTYFLVYPSVLGALLRRIVETGTQLPALRQVRTVGELLPPHTRALCREVLGVPIVDMYSAQEVGPIALQCPDHEHYHLQEERLLVEIVRQDSDTACAPGEVGRVVITDLHNFATPLVRYDIGDLAELGEPCACRRGLRVLRRVIGRTRNLVLLPDGSTKYPVFTVAAREAARFRDIQLVQMSRDTMRARVVPHPDAPLDESALITALQRSLGHPFTIQVESVDEIARTPAGKLEEFVSRVL